MEDKSAEMGEALSKVQRLVARNGELETALRNLVKALKHPDAFPYPEFMAAKEVLNRP